MSLRGVVKSGTPRDTVYSRGKAHTSKRVSIIACNNVISKVQCATHRPEGLPYKREVYFLTKS